MNRRILQIAIPAIVSNITVPLLGLVDMWIVGHIGAASYIGAIAVGGMIFSMIYWIFAFLRMGTGGLTAQAYGRRGLDDAAMTFARSLAVALALAIVLVAAQKGIAAVAFAIVDASDEVAALASLYFSICIWGAPAVLGFYALTGWFVGMQNSRFPMYIAITQNIVNIVASLIFVFVLDMSVAGVALGTLIAQWAGFAMGLILWSIYYGRLWWRIRWGTLLDGGAMMVFFRLNADIFIRTLCLVAVTVYFTSAGARQGDTILAVNTLLMQLFILFSYVMDGFAYAGEALTGRYVGAGDGRALRRMIARLFVWGAVLTGCFTAVYAFGGTAFLSLITDARDVIEAAADYLPWAAAIPAAGMAAFLWDGVFIGATASRLMLYSMMVGAGGFFAIVFSSGDDMSNHTLWLAFIVYLFSRGAMQTLLAKRMIMKL